MLYEIEMSENLVICTFVLESGFRLLKNRYNPSLHSHLQSFIAMQWIQNHVLPSLFWL